MTIFSWGYKTFYSPLGTPLRLTQLVVCACVRAGVFGQKNRMTFDVDICHGDSPWPYVDRGHRPLFKVTGGNQASHRASTVSSQYTHSL